MNKASSALRVNARRLLRILPFTALALVAAVNTARADRILVLRPLGEANEAQRGVVESSLRSALESLSYETVLESALFGGSDESAAPEDANDFRALGDLARCEYVLAPAVAFVDGGYRLTLRVGYAPRTRLETLTAEVRAVREHDRLVEILRAVLRPEGMGDAPSRFAGPDEAALALDAAAAEDRARHAAEDEARRAAEDEARRRAEEEAARLAEEEAQRQGLAEREAQHQEDEAREAWENRERYGRPDRMAVLGGVGLLGILNADPGARGGAIAELQGRFGYALRRPVGLELRGGLDIDFGATGGFALTGGAVYYVSPWANRKVHLGGGLELGFYQALSGNRVPQLWVRAEGLVAWHATNKIWLEGAFPSFTVLSANSGIVTLGFAARVGTRF